MRKLAWWAFACAACKGGDHTSVPAGSAAVAPARPAMALKLVGCAPATVPPRPSGDLGSIDSAPTPARAEPPPPTVVAASPKRAPRRVPPAPKPSADPHIADTREWTPYAASEGIAPADIATVAARELEQVIAERLPKLDACFGGRTASLRAVLRVAFDGSVIGARAGGVGDHQIEACVAGTLIGLKVGAPPIIAEVACDFQRGDPQPWRVTVDAGYHVLDVGAAGIAHDGKPVDLAAPVSPSKDAETTYVLVADPSVPAAALDQAMNLTVEGSATLVAVRIDHGAPVFAGMGLDGRNEHGTGDPIGAKPIVIDPSRELVAACVGDASIGSAPRSGLDALFGAIEKACATATCASSIEIALAGAATANDLADLAGSARRAGFVRLVLGGDARCR